MFLQKNNKIETTNENDVMCKFNNLCRIQPLYCIYKLGFALLHYSTGPQVVLLLDVQKLYVLQELEELKRTARIFCIYNCRPAQMNGWNQTFRLLYAECSIYYFGIWDLIHSNRRSWIRSHSEIVVVSSAHDIPFRPLVWPLLEIFDNY